MRVCGFVYSPRREANSELAVKEIMKQLPDDWEKVMVRLNDLDIKPCQACYHCVPRGSHCAISDDLDVIIRNVKHSDRIIIAFPTYIFTAPGPVVCLRNSKSKVDFVGDLAYPIRLSF